MDYWRLCEFIERWSLVTRQLRRFLNDNTQITTQSRETMSIRRGLVCALLLVPLVIFVSGCNNNSTNVDRKITITMSTDIKQLQRLIHLPSGVMHCEWQTGSTAGW